MFSKSSLKYIQSLQHKKFRDEYNVFVAEGPKVVTGLLSTDKFPVKHIYALQGWVDEMGDDFIKFYANQIVIVKDFELDKIASYTTANKVVAVFEKTTVNINIQTSNKFTLVLDDIRDPGNLGTIIRTADWFGIENIICSPDTVDMYNSKVVQSTMASLGNVNILYEVLPAWIKNQKNINILAATLTGRPITECNDIKEAIIIIGNESKGVSNELIKLAKDHIMIPRYGKAESLNAAVATGIILSNFMLR